MRERGRSLDLQVVHVHFADQVLVVAVQVRLAAACVSWGPTVIVAFEIAPRWIACGRFRRGWNRGLVPVVVTRCVQRVRAPRIVDAAPGWRVPVFHQKVRDARVGWGFRAR